IFKFIKIRTYGIKGLFKDSNKSMKKIKKDPVIYNKMQDFEEEDIPETELAETNLKNNFQRKYSSPSLDILDSNLKSRNNKFSKENI